MPSYWVSPPPTGDDANPGSQAEPWATFDKAATTMVAGDDCTFTDGAYPNTEQSSFNSGSVGSYITFKSQNALGAELQFDDVTGGRLFDMSSESYLRFEDLSMKGITTAGAQLIRMVGCDHIEFVRCEIYNTRVWGVTVQSCTDMLFEGCVIHTDNTIEDYSGDGVQVSGASADITFDGCEVYNCDHNGIKLYEVDGCTIKYCVIRDCQSHNLSIGGAGSDVAQNVTVYGCRLSDAGSYDPTPAQEMGVRIHDACDNVEVYQCDIEGSNGPGVGFADVTGTGTVNVHDNTLYNNDINGSNWGSIFVEYQVPGNTPDITIENNVIYHTQANRSMLVQSGAEAYVSIDYNLWYDSTDTEEIRRDGTTYTTYLAYAGSYEPNSVFSDDPLFHGAASNDFMLLATSPAIDEGTDTGLDYTGSAPDIGAHEFWSATHKASAPLRETFSSSHDSWALLKETQTASCEGWAGLAGTLTAGHPASAALEATATGGHDSSATLKETATGTHVATASLQKAATVGHEASAALEVQGRTTDHVSWSLLKSPTVEASHEASAALEATGTTGSHDASASLEVAAAASHDTWAGLQETPTANHICSSALEETFSRTHAASAALGEAGSANHGAWAHLDGTFTATCVAFAVLEDVAAASHVAWARFLVIVTLEKQHVASAALETASTADHTVSAPLQETFTSAHDAWAGLEKTQTASHESGATLEATSESTHAAHAPLRETFSRGHGSSAALQETFTSTHDSWAGLEQTVAPSHAADAVLFAAATTATHLSSAALQETFTAGHAASAALEETGAADHDAWACLKETTAVGHDAFASLKAQGETAGHLSFAVLEDTFTATHQASGPLQETFTATHAGWAYLATRRTASHDTAAELKASLTGVHTVLAYLCTFVPPVTALSAEFDVTTGLLAEFDVTTGLQAVYDEDAGMKAER